LIRRVISISSGRIGRRQRRKAMRKMGIVVVVIGVVVVLAAGSGWLACGGWKQIGTRFEDDTSSDAAITEIRATGGSVDVELRPGIEPGVRIHRTVRYLNPLHPRPGPTSRIDGAVLRLGSDDSCTLCAVEYVVVAPAGVRVSADVGTGSINLTGASAVDVKVSTGSITVTEATGDVTARAETGSITGRGLRSGTVVATAKTGGISLDLAAPADVEATTSMGSVELTVPAAAYRVDATTGLGRADVGIANDPNGRYRLALRTDTGNLVLGMH
jgi:hypothetical protein